MQEIEQLKRDLKSYGYYKKLKIEIDIQVNDLNARIEALEQAGGTKFNGKVYTYKCKSCEGYDFLTEPNRKGAYCSHCGGELVEEKEDDNIHVPRPLLVPIADGTGSLLDSLNATLGTLLDLQEEVEGELRHHSRLIQTLGVLSKEQRTIVERHYFQGMPFATIGALMGMSRSTVIRVSKESVQLLYNQKDEHVQKVVNAICES